MKNKNSGSKQINVTRPSLPPLEEIEPYLRQIWCSGVITNCGPLHKELEERLCDYLDAPYVSLFSNGTIALMAAISACELKGELITTPYTFLATAQSIIWNNLTPVFVDVEPETGNLDPFKTEQAITDKTVGVLPVHVYGRPCDLEAFDALGKKYRLKIIYDAAHAFGVRRHCGSVLTHGDVSVVSFHATKVFNTFEGGAVITNSEQLKKKLDQFRNFGFRSTEAADIIGLNGKMSELNSAVGIIQLRYIDQYIQSRKKVSQTYIDQLKSIPGIECMDFSRVERHNYSYFPIIVGHQYPLSRDELFDKLVNHGIGVRKYFFPLVTQFSCMSAQVSGDSKFPNAESLSGKVICLPIYPELKFNEIKFITDIITDLI